MHNRLGRKFSLILSAVIAAQVVVSGTTAEASSPTSYLVWANAGYAGSAGDDFALGNSAINASRIGATHSSRQWISGTQNRGGYVAEPLDVVMDSAKGYVYWTDDYGVERSRIGGCLASQRCNTNLYGTMELTGHLPGYEYVTGLTLDSTRNYLYVGVYSVRLSTYRIMKLKADGSSTPSDALVLPSAQAIPAESGIGSIVPFEGKLYFTVDARGPGDSISWASLSSSAHGDLAMSPEIVNRPWGLAVDVKNRALYWANWESGDTPAGTISKWDFSTGLASDLYTTSSCSAGLRGPAGVAVDSTAGKIYWGNFNGGEPTQGSINSGACSSVNTSGITNRQQASVALIKSPTMVTAPKISLKKTSHAVLGCTIGTWLSDVSASRLFQAPETSKFTYSWKRNGKTISGTTSTLRAKASGVYSCTVKATNYAGSMAGSSRTLNVTAKQAR